MRLGRRKMLGLAASALAMARPARSQSPFAVAVIGAGMAGLAAARALSDKGIAVTVYEARNRIGGRVWTSRLWPDLPLDMGASWIHGTRGNPLTRLADEVGATRVATSYNSAIALLPGGQEADPPEPWDIVEAAQDLANDAPTDMSLQAAVLATKVWQRADTATRAAIRQAIHRAVEHEYAADWSALSARSFDDSDAFKGGDVLFPSGFGQLADHAARGLDIRLSHPVARVAQSADGVTLHLQDGRSTNYDAAIVTVPLGVLQSGGVGFDPALPQAQETALSALGMGSYVKCWLRFAAPLPLPAVDWIAALGPPALENPKGQTPLWPEWVHLQRTLGQPVLLAFAAGHAAQVGEAMDRNTAIRAALATAQRMSPTPLPDLVGAQISGWGRDPFAQGAYSFARPGGGAHSRAALAHPLWDGRLMLAGEHTSTDHPSTVHGAWLSGLAAAAQITRP